MNRGDCSLDVADLLPWFLNGTLDAEQTARVRAHLETCDACLDQLDALNAAVGVVAPSLRAEGSVVRRKTVLGILAGAAAVLLVVILGARFLELRRPSTPPAAAGGATVLDLGAGATRGGVTAPTLVLDSATPWVVLSFRPNPAIGPEARVDIVRGGAAAVVSNLRLGPLDPFGRATIVLPAHTVATLGSYTLVVTDAEVSGQPRSYEYPFTTASPRSRD